MATTLRRSRSKYGRTRRQRRKQRRIRGGGIFDDIINKFKPSTPQEKCDKAKQEAEEICNSISQEQPEQEQQDLSTPAPAESLSDTPPLSEDSILAPSASESVMPSASEPVMPSASEPVMPSASESVMPSASEPVMPSASEPVMPSASEPVTPNSTYTEMMSQQTLEPLKSSQQQVPEYKPQTVGFGGTKKSKRRNKKQSRRKKHKSKKYKK